MCELKLLGNVFIIGDLNSRTGTQCDIDTQPNTSFCNFEIPNHSPVFMNEEESITPQLIQSLGHSVSRVSQDKVVNSHGRKLIDLCQASNLIMLNGRVGSDMNHGSFTFSNHRGNSVDDYCLVDKQLLYHCTNFEVKNINIFSDHVPIVVYLNCMASNSSLPFDNNSSTHIIYKWNKEAKNDYINETASVDFISQLTSLSQEIDFPDSDINSIVDNFSTLILDSAKHHKKVIIHSDNLVQCNTEKNVWFDSECNDLQKEFKNAEQNYHIHGDNISKNHICSLRNKYRKKCRIKKRNYEKNCAINLANLNKTNPKKFWKSLKRNKKIISKCDFHSFFKNMSDQFFKVNEDAENEIFNYEFLETKVEELDTSFVMSELESAIKQAKVDKSHGTDKLINEFFINANSAMKDFLLKLFNKILSSEKWPDKWAEGIITPVFKKGDNNIASNYRAVVLVSCLAKIFTSMLNKRLYNWSYNCHLISEKQFGFQKNKSTVDCLFILQSLVQHSFSVGKSIYCSFIDYSRAFDSINHEALFYKLHKTGISSKVLNIIKMMYNKIKLCMRPDLVDSNIRNSNDYYFKPAAGVLQGEVISSYLFTIFVNDLPDILASPTFNPEEIIINLLMYADDMCCMSYSREGLQLALNDLSDYCDKWGLEVNTLKSKCMVFRRNGRIYAKDKWTLKNNILETVKEFKYLGYSLSTSGSHSNGVKNLRSSAHRAMFSLKCIFQKYKYLSPKIQLSLFNSMIKPILTYGCEIWGAQQAKILDVVHLKFLKYILGVRQSTPSSYVYGELGEYPLYIERHVRMINYWLKVISLPDSSLAKTMYNVLLNDLSNNPTTNNWAANIKSILQTNGFGYVWARQGISDSNKVFSNKLRTRIQDQYIQYWNESIQSTSDHRLYKTIYTTFGLQKYLCDISISEHRKALTKIRLGSHNFLIERGRWNVPKLDFLQRKCETCNIIEDEFHCIFECTRFSDQRKNLPNYLNKKPSMFKFISLLKSNNTQD